VSAFERVLPELEPFLALFETFHRNRGSSRLHVDADSADGPQGWKRVATETVWPHSADVGV
jgi:hypothetical protein